MEKKFHRLDRLEMLRGAAALYVALSHSIIWHFTPTYSVLGIFLSFGEEAVIAFFLLSGFVIYYSVTLEQNMTFTKYFFKRFVRIYPLLFVAFLLSYILFSLQEKHFVAMNARDFFGNILMLQSNIYMNPGSQIAPYYDNAPLWSLAFEWYFYMIFYPLNKYLDSRYIKQVILGISIFGCVTFFSHPNQISAILLYLVIWWMGVELARTYIDFKMICFKDISFLFGSLVLLAFLMIYPVMQSKETMSGGVYPFIQLRHFCSAILLLLVGFSWSKYKFAGYDLIFGIFKKIAPISYGIYIFHWPILNYHGFLNGVTFQPLRLWLMLLTVLLFSYVFEMYFQKIVASMIVRKRTTSPDLMDNKRFLQA